MDSQYHQQYDTITSGTHISTLLSISQNSQTAIKITLPDSHTVYESSLVDADFLNRQLVISKLGDDTAHKKLLRNKRLKIFCQTNGSDFCFTTQLISTDKHDGKIRYLVEIPKSVKYRQRRSAYRKHISLAQNITATLNDQEGKIWTGQLRDISSGGMKLQISQEKPEQLVCESVIPDCRISLPDMNDIVCSFRVRHYRVNDRNTEFTVGGNFIDLEHQQKRTIERFIADLDRKSMRGYSV